MCRGGAEGEVIGGEEGELRGQSDDVTMEDFLQIIGYLWGHGWVCPPVDYATC